eukprot:2747746-Pyramimonas_sp.AAC.1
MSIAQQLQQQREVLLSRPNVRARGAHDGSLLRHTLGRGRLVLPAAQRGALCPVDHPGPGGPLLFSGGLVEPGLLRAKCPRRALPRTE